MLKGTCDGPLDKRYLIITIDGIGHNRLNGIVYFRGWRPLFEGRRRKLWPNWDSREEPSPITHAPSESICGPFSPLATITDRFSSSWLLDMKCLKHTMCLTLFQYFLIQHIGFYISSPQHYFCLKCIFNQIILLSFLLCVLKYLMFFLLGYFDWSLLTY